MDCPKCNSQTQVIETRSQQKYIRRRRGCLFCGFRFTTHETSIDESQKVDLKDMKERLHNAIDRVLEEEPT